MKLFEKHKILLLNFINVSTFLKLLKCKTTGEPFLSHIFARVGCWMCRLVKLVKTKRVKTNLLRIAGEEARTKDDRKRLSWPHLAAHGGPGGQVRAQAGDTEDQEVIQ